ncbi:MAG: dTMP kinase [Deltaproteobacteria bacterium]|nr:dTMP kinase [Deltaproteobacteria bacterium]
MSLLITFEGIEGSGKTTQIHLLHQQFKQKGLDSILTREPGGTPIGQEIRNLLLDRKNEHLASRAELFLYAADRAQHLHEVVLPALEKKQIVLCDRYIDATTAYQAGGRQLEEDLVQQMIQLASQNLKPHLTFLVDCPVEIGLSRAQKRAADVNDRLDRFERLALEFHERVRRRYLQIAQEEPARVKVIDGTQSIDLIQKEILSIIDTLLT